VFQPQAVSRSPDPLVSSDPSDHHVYVIECSDGSLYTGYTTDVQRRVSEHDAGDGAKYTRGRTPVELVYTESFDSKSAAMAREYEIKQLSRPEKERLVFGG
jgi:putative endonuclease